MRATRKAKLLQDPISYLPLLSPLCFSICFGVGDASYLLCNEGKEIITSKIISQCQVRMILPLHVDTFPEKQKQWKRDCPWQMDLSAASSWILAFPDPPCPAAASVFPSRHKCHCQARARIFPALAAGGFLPFLWQLSWCPREVYGAVLGWCWPPELCFALLSGLNSLALALQLCSVPCGTIAMKDLSAFSGEGVNFRHLKLSNKSCFKQEYEIQVLSSGVTIYAQSFRTAV